MTQTAAISYSGRDLLELTVWVFLGQDLNLRMEVGEGEVILSVYKRAMMAKAQMTTVMMGRGSFPREGFIVARGEWWEWRAGREARSRRIKE